MKELDYIYLWFKRAGLTNRRILSLKESLGDVRNILDMKEKDIVKLGLLEGKDASRLFSVKDYSAIEALHEDMYLKGIQFIYEETELYPERLRQTEDRPYAFFAKGDISKISPAVCIVGARECSEYGSAVAYKAARELSARGITIISGLARGIDTYAHKGAMDGGGRTIAVLGCGVNICYPRENIETYMKIQEKGCIVSEYLPDVPPLSRQFPVRNRIISGLSDVLLLIEAREKSGSLITVDQALEQGREVFVLPGRISDNLSTGCNRLIKCGASVFTETTDILEYLSDIYHINENNIISLSENQKLTLASNEKIVYSCLDLYPKSLEKLLSETQLSMQEVTSILLNLELSGYIKEVTKNYYVINME